MNRTDPGAPPSPTHFEDGPDEPARPGPRSIVRCLNCDHPVDGRFCGHCGQQRLLRPLSLGALLWDLAIEVLDTDARVWRTLRTLIRQPGQLTLDWVAGRRARHVPPFRLYLVLNLLAFLLISLQADPAPPQSVGAQGAETTLTELRAELAELADATSPADRTRRRHLESALAILEQARATRAEAPATPAPGADGSMAGDTGQARAEPRLDVRFRLGDNDELFGLVDRLESIGYSRARIEARIGRLLGSPQQLLDTMLTRIPTLLLVLLPLLATALRGLYLLSDRPFVLHLVGLAHLHAFIFLLLLLTEGFTGIGLIATTLGAPAFGAAIETTAGTFGGIAFAVYVLLWVRRLYGHGWAGTAGMSVVISLLHVVGIGIGVALLLLGTILLEVVGQG